MKQHRPALIAWLLFVFTAVAHAQTNLPPSGGGGDVVDPGTIDGKLMMGYQGWFACPGDGFSRAWVHWFRHYATADNAVVDFWPDVSELSSSELFATHMTLPDGSPASVYSATNPKTVARHFKWMKDNHLDGVFLQRFLADLSTPYRSRGRNQVEMNVQKGAEAYGRVFAMMYDISGQYGPTLVSKITNDWLYLVRDLHMTNSPSYLRQHGRPVVCIWGFGFTDRPGTPRDAKKIIAWFKAAGCTVMGGVPARWRTLDRDSQSDAEWTDVYHSFDIISPWAVGRYSSEDGADNFKDEVIVPDLADCKAHGIEYMPVVFPGFSWHNLNGGELNQIPRNGGRFYWRQIYNAVSAGCPMIYGAMFDEMNEGTSMFKMAATPAQLPAQGKFVPLNIDGENLPNDWYLRLADQAGKMLRGEIPLKADMPIKP